MSNGNLTRHFLIGTGIFRVLFLMYLFCYLMQNHVTYIQGRVMIESFSYLSWYCLLYVEYSIKELKTILFLSCMCLYWTVLNARVTLIGIYNGEVLNSKCSLVADGSCSLSPVWQMLVTAPYIRPYHFQALDWSFETIHSLVACS